MPPSAESRVRPDADQDRTADGIVRTCRPVSPDHCQKLPVRSRPRNCHIKKVFGGLWPQRCRTRALMQGVASLSPLNDGETARIERSRVDGWHLAAHKIGHDAAGDARQRKTDMAMAVGMDDPPIARRLPDER